MIRRRHVQPVLCLFLIAVTVGLGGCEFYGDKERTWTEDVVLDDGTQVTIERHVKFTDHNSLAQDSYGAIETEATLQFQGHFSALPTWSDALIPLVLYRSHAAGEWVIVAKTSACEIWRNRGKPIPPYWEYRIKDGKWQMTALSAESIGRKTNLFFNYHAGLPSKHMTIDDKRRDRASHNTWKPYLQVSPAEEMQMYCQT
jgi:hypothetical protein